MRDTSGAVTGVMETLEDVTGQKQREFQVRSGS
jgi:signal transduction histidine kinase